MAQKVQKAILRSARKKHANILLDLQSVHFIDSAAIAMLIEVNERLSGTGNNFFLTGITKEAMELIQLAPVLKDMIKPTDCNQEPLPEK